MYKLSIIIPTCNRGAIFEHTLLCAIEATSGINAEIIVINDSKISTVKLKTQYVNVIVYDNPSSGAASARNLGVKHVSGDLLLFIDDDIIITKESIDTVFALHKKYPKACFNLNWKYSDELVEEMSRTQLGRFIIWHKQVNYQSWAANTIQWNEKELFEVKKLATFFLLIPKEVFDKNGGFNESFKNSGVEDDEFTKRLYQNGIKLYINPLCYIYHNESDKMNVSSSMKRIKTRAYNMRMAYNNGMTEYYIKYSPSNIMRYSILVACNPILLMLIKIIPNYKIFDKIFRVYYSGLISIATFQGYYRNHPGK